MIVMDHFGILLNKTNVWTNYDEKDDVPINCFLDENKHNTDQNPNMGISRRIHAQVE